MLLNAYFGHVLTFFNVFYFYLNVFYIHGCMPPSIHLYQKYQYNKYI